MPRVIDGGVVDAREADAGSASGGEAWAWLLTSEVPGVPAIDPALRWDPAALVAALARGLRTFHETPAADCPFDFRLKAARAHVRARVAAGQVDPERHFHPEHRGLTLERALAIIEATELDEDVVLCHGDYCLPNVLLTGDALGGYVDLGELGLADRWWDLAVATWSLDWDLGPGWETTFLEAYGARPDRDRMRFYRLLYDLAS